MADTDAPREYRWSRNGERLWTRGDDWIEWDPIRGERLRHAKTPEGLREPILAAERSAPIEYEKDFSGKSRQCRQIVALSRDLQRAVVRSPYPHGRSCALYDVQGGGQLDPLEGLAAPYAFSDDGRRLVAAARGWRELVVLDAADARVLVRIPFGRLSHTMTSALWAPGGELVLKSFVPGHTDDSLVCFHVDYQRPLWEVKGYFPRLQVDADGKRLAALDPDDAVHIIEMASGERLQLIPRSERGAGPVVAGEPDTAALIERLAKHPIAFTYPKAVTAIRTFAGGEKAAVWRGHEERPRVVRVLDGAELDETTLPWDPPPFERIRQALAEKSDVEAYGCRAVSSDGGLCFFLLGRDRDEQQDPDAGTIVRYRVSAALWDARLTGWRWETSSSPDRFLLAWLFEQGSFQFSGDDSGIFITGSGYGRAVELYDAATGKLRPPTPGDFVGSAEGVSLPERQRALAVDGAAALAVGFAGTRACLWDLKRAALAGAVELGLDQPAVARFTAPGFLLGTTLGRLFHFSLT